MMTDEEIEFMLKMHRFMIHCEVRQIFDQYNQNDRAAKLQEQVNDGEWDRFAEWLRKIRDE
jgi:hypothetical protein